MLSVFDEGNGGLEVLQPNAPHGKGASSPLDADLDPPYKPCLSSYFLTQKLTRNSSLTIHNRLFWYLTCFLIVNKGYIRFFCSNLSTKQCILQRGVAELCSNDGGCSLFDLSLITTTHYGVHGVAKRCRV